MQTILYILTQNPREYFPTKNRYTPHFKKNCFYGADVILFTYIKAITKRR